MFNSKPVEAAPAEVVYPGQLVKLVWETEIGRGSEVVKFDGEFSGFDGFWIVTRFAGFGETVVVNVNSFIYGEVVQQ